MSRKRRLDPARAQRLLDGTADGSDPVARLLGAARAPAQPHELRQEDIAVAAFRAAGAAGLEPGRPVRAGRGRRWAQVLGVKAAVAGVTIFAAGVAVAASTGVLPIPFVPPVPPVVAPESPPAAASGDLSPSGSGPAAGGPPSPGPSSTAAAHASLVGQCRAYQARGDREPAAAVGGAAFAALVVAAGGPDRVAAFCADLLATPTASAEPSATPTVGTDQPGDRGAGRGNGHPPSTKGAPGPPAH